MATMPIPKMMLLLFFLAPVFADTLLPSASSTFSHSNHDPKYDIVIHSRDAPYIPEPGQESIFMTDRDGQKCKCFLPNEDENRRSKEQQPSSGTVTLFTDKQNKIKTPEELLEPLKDLCFLRREGWWSYEFCYKGKVRQVHLEEQKIVQEYVLGVYDKEATAALHQSSPDVSVQKDPRSRTAAQRYYAQMYKNGTLCDLTNEQREIQVRFVCSETNRILIQSIKEVATCKYQMIIQCPLLCKHPLFQEERPAYYTINCNIIASRMEKEGGKKDGVEIALPELVNIGDRFESSEVQ